MEKDNAKEEIEVLDNFDINKKEEPIKEEKIEKKQKKEKKPREKRKMKKGEKIFFIINFLLLLGIVGFYAYRTVYYYKISHEVNEEITLRDKIIGFDNVVYQNDGLYEKDEVYYFKGTDVNNYLYFSGNMYRIIEINKGIKAILDDTVTNLVWGIEGNYEESIIYSWLSDTYINSLKDYEAYLQKNNWCNESIDVEKYNCKETISDFVGLLSTEEYLRAGGKNSYLNNGTYFWTINQDSDGKALYVNIDGSINNLNYKDENYYSYGIRGVITFREDLLLTSGEGTKNDPYIIEDNSGVLVRDKAVGSYVKYNDETFRVLSVDEDGVSLILDGIIEEEKKNWDILGYLNND